MKKNCLASLMIGTCLLISGCPFVDMVAERFGYVPEQEEGWATDVIDVLNEFDDFWD